MSDWLKKAREEFDHIEKSEYGQLTDGEIRTKQFLKEWQPVAKVMGGKVTGKQHKENGTGIFAQTLEERQENGATGGNTCKEEGIIQETQYRSSQTEHECPTCGKKGKGNLFKSLHFDKCGRQKKKPKPKFAFQVYDDGKLIQSFDKIDDIAEWYGCSVSLISMFISGKRIDKKHGYTYKKVSVE